jgi:O-antigen/teichoic acid export membrane protein
LITRNVVIRFLQLAFQFTITVVIARLLAPTGYGYFSIFISEVALFTLLLGLSIEGPVLYFVSKKQLNISQIFSLALYLFVLQIALFFAVYFLAKFYFGYTFFLIDSGTTGYIWAAVYIFSLIVFNFCNSYLSGKGQFYNQVLWPFIFQVLVVLLFIALFQAKVFKDYFFNNAKNIIPFYCILFFLQAVVSIVLVLRSNSEPMHLKVTKPLLPQGFVKYASFVFLANLVQFFSYRADVWILDFFKGKEALGQYALAVKFGQIWWLLPQLLSSLVFPLSALENNSMTHKKFLFYIKVVLGIGLIGSIIAIFILPFIIELVAGQSYLPAYQLLLILLPGLVLFSICILFSARLAGQGNTKINLQASLICFFVVMVFDFILIPKYSSIGAAISSTIGYTFTTIFIMLKFRQWNQSKK